MEKTEPKILVFDLETLGLTAYDPILCISWQEYGSKEVHFRAAWEDEASWNRLTNAKTIKEIEKAFQGIDKQMLKDVFPVLKSADCLIGHFEDYFDIPFVKTRLLKHGIGFLPKYIQTDTWKIARAHLKMRSNRLVALNEFFGLQKKLKQNDLSLWTAVKAGNKFAMKEMERYNKRDVTSTAALVKKLSGYAKFPLILPKHSNGAKRSCVKPNCTGSMGSKGLRYTTTGVYQRLECRKCGAFGRTMKKKSEVRAE